MALVLGVRWSFRGKDAGSVRIHWIRARLRTRPRGEQRAPRAQPVFRQALLDASGEGRNRTGDTTVFSRVLYQLSYLAAVA
jgi:hypothetical protein